MVLNLFVIGLCKSSITGSTWHECFPDNVGDVSLPNERLVDRLVLKWLEIN